MVSDRQVRKLRRQMGKGCTVREGAAKADMDEKTARKYLRKEGLPSEVGVGHTWRTREDPFGEIWDVAKALLEVNPGLEARSLFEHLQQQHPGRFSDGQLRTFQRRVKVWRALEGQSREVFFPQVYEPGELSESDFTWMNKLGILIAGQPFDHLLYHFVLPYSNWETGSVCFSESYESLAMGLQKALWKLGGVTKAHQTDRLSTAVRKTTEPQQFTEGYRGLLRHYRMEPRTTQADSPHENGDVEQRHHRVKRAMEQALLLRGSREFTDRGEYEGFLERLFEQLNAGRKARFAEEQAVLQSLPCRRLEACRVVDAVRVSAGSTISVKSNVYSVHSRLIGERVRVKLYHRVAAEEAGGVCALPLPGGSVSQRAISVGV
jgi:transposase InsO family protein